MLSTSRYPATIDKLPSISRCLQSPPVTQKTIRLSKKRAAIAVDPIPKANTKAKKKVTRLSDRYCKGCKLSCDSSKTLYDLNNSKRHKNALQNGNTNFSIIFASAHLCAIKIWELTTLKLPVSKNYKNPVRKKCACNSIL